MRRWNPLILPLLWAIPLLVGVAGAPGEEGRVACEIDCAESEERCYEECGAAGDTEACEQACYATAEACFDRCASL